MVNVAKSVTTVLMIVTAWMGACGSDSTKVNLIPDVHITLKAQFEDDVDVDEARFLVRNARFAMSGDVLPQLNYQLQLDLCEKGKVKILDACAGIRPVKELNVIMGQTKLPLPIDRSRAVSKYYFTDFSYVGYLNGGIRGVGMRVDYRVPKTRLDLSGMIYNTYNIANHDVWQNRMSYVVEAQWGLGVITPAIGFMSNVPETVRINNLMTSLIFGSGRWHAEAAYYYRHYTHHAFNASHAYSVMADYALPLHRGFFNRLSFQARLDGITAYSDGTMEGDRLAVTGKRSTRLTLGSTVAHIKGEIDTHLRLNYYMNFRPSGDTAPIGEGNKLVAEFTLRF